jgi:alpha-L-rhamnosidase
MPASAVGSPVPLTVTATVDDLAASTRVRASFPDGVPVDFTISTWNGSAWVQQAQVTGNDRVDRWIPFGAPVSTTQVQLTVTLDQNAYAGEFTRVAELDP